MLLKGYRLKQRNLQRERIQILVRKHVHPPNALMTSSLELLVVCCLHEPPSQRFESPKYSFRIQPREFVLSSTLTPDTVRPIAALPRAFPSQKQSRD